MGTSWEPHGKDIRGSNGGAGAVYKEASI